MNVLELFPLDPLVHLPGTFESPEYLPDCIAVAAEECSASYSQGSSSPETYISATDDINLELLDDLPRLNEDVAKEIVNDLVCEDPSFGSVLIDGDICDILDDNEELVTYKALLDESYECLPNDQLAHDMPTRRKQRIVPMASEPFECEVHSSTFNDVVYQLNVEGSRKRPYEAMNKIKCPSTKKPHRVISAYTTLPYDSVFSANDQRFEKNSFEKFSSCKNYKDQDDSKSDTTDSDRSSGIRQRKRGLTQDERKERKKQSNRNASYRYRQKKKEENDGFFQSSVQILDAFEQEKEAYKNIVEEFIRCIKHAKLVSDARGERKMGLYSSA